MFFVPFSSTFLVSKESQYSVFVMICLLCSKKNFSIMIIHGNTQNFKVPFKKAQEFHILIREGQKVRTGLFTGKRRELSSVNCSAGESCLLSFSNLGAAMAVMQGLTAASSSPLSAAPWSAEPCT